MLEELYVVALLDVQGGLADALAGDDEIDSVSSFAGAFLLGRNCFPLAGRSDLGKLETKRNWSIIYFSKTIN